jgi:hypothetical protein
MPDGITPICRTAGWMVFEVLDSSKASGGGALPPWVVDILRALKKQNGVGTSDLQKMLALTAEGADGTEDTALLPWAAQNKQQQA